MAKPKISSDWMAGCAGCHMSLLDIDDRIIKIAELADIRATPITDLSQITGGAVFPAGAQKSLIVKVFVPAGATIGASTVPR